MVYAYSARLDGDMLLQTRVLRQTGTIASERHGLFGDLMDRENDLKLIGWVTGLCIAALLAGCGGGGGASTTPPPAALGQVTLKTTMGDIVIELYPSNAPLTVANFKQYVTEGFYTNKIFHRVVKDFVVQGGGFDSSLQAGATHAAIKLEAHNGLSNVRGSVAMARTSALDSATSQFYINVVDNVTLDTNGGGYAVFGKVISGMAVVDAMNVVATHTVGDFSDVPVTPIVITAATQTQ